MSQESAQQAIGKSVAHGAIRATAYHVTIAYIIPIGLPAVTGYLGYLEGLPWMYIVLGVGVMFAAISTGLLRFSEWLDRGRVAGKLEFSSIRFVKDSRGEGLCIGIVLVSKAAVPIGIEVDEIRTRISNLVPTKTVYELRRFTIPPGGTFTFTDHAIRVGPFSAPPKIDGVGEFRFKYGKDGNLKYSFTTKKAVVGIFNAAGDLTGSASHDMA